MTAPVLMNAVQIAWMSLLRQEQISAVNIETAPLRVLSAIMQASAHGERNPHALAAVALADWNEKSACAALH